MRKQRSQKEQLQRRIIMRRIRLIVEFIFVITSVAILPLLDKIGQTPNWVGSWLYTVLVIVGALIIFGIYWIWLESGEKTELDEVDTHGQARGTLKFKFSLDALWASSHSPTGKPVELCPSGSLEEKIDSHHDDVVKRITKLQKDVKKLK